MLVNSIFTFVDNAFYLQRYLIISSESNAINPLILVLTHQQQTAFENIVGKGEIARKEQFLLFPQCFLTVSSFVKNFVIISLFAAELEEPKIGISGKGLSLIP